MGIRVRVRIRFALTGRVVETVALVNSRAESERPSVVVGEGEARLLGAESPEAYGAVLYLVEEATARSLAYVIRGGAVLELLGEGGEVLSSVTADLVIQPGVAEPLLTDAAIDELGIQPVSFSKGLWRHVSDPPGSARHLSPRLRRGVPSSSARRLCWASE